MNKIEELHLVKGNTKNGDPLRKHDNFFLSIPGSGHQLPEVAQQQPLPVQQQQGINLDALKGQWQQKVGAAKVTWGKLTDDEILQCEGQGQKLAGLVQERYAISREAAEKQVEDFMAKHDSKI